MVTKTGTMVTNLQHLPPIMSLYRLVTWSREIKCQTKNHYVSTTRVPIATKLDRMMTNLQGILHNVTLHFGHVVL